MTDKTNENKRLDSTIKYVDALLGNHSKLNIIRVDLSYKKPYSDNVTPDKANQDLNHLFNNMRSKPTIFKDQIGHICKREYTKDKGVHIHAVFIYDGQKIKNDSHKAQQIGEYWNQVTQKEGSFYNCHYNDYEKIGIGMLEHNDTEKREILNDKVISYLCKDDQSIKAIKDTKKAKAFTRGIMPKKKSNKGRPRG